MQEDQKMDGVGAHSCHADIADGCVGFGRGTIDRAICDVSVATVSANAVHFLILLHCKADSSFSFLAYSTE